jgi:hypothetical protein
MPYTYRLRRLIAVSIVVVVLISLFIINGSFEQPVKQTVQSQTATNSSTTLAAYVVNTLALKGRAPKTNYSREQFGPGWATVNGCDTRNIILNRDVRNPVVDENCNVLSGILNDPYTGKAIEFKRGLETSADVQIDHVVALSDAWQTGAQHLTKAQRIALANDPLELLAVDGPANQQKSDGDAATWLPSNKPFRCQYVARQVAIKKKYGLWVTQPEKDAILGILKSCPTQKLPNNVM